jgi:DNA-binding transcriptional LysR family regulator
MSTDRPASDTALALKPAQSAALQVTCPTAFAATLERIAPALQARHPDIALLFSGANRTVDLARGDADIAVRMFPGRDANVVSLQSVDLGWQAYASKGYLADHGAVSSADELTDHRLVLYGAALHRVPGPRWIEDRCGPSTNATRVQNPEVAAQVIAAGEGIGVIPCIAASNYPNLVPVFPMPVATQTCWIVYDRRAVRDVEYVHQAAEALRALMLEHAALFLGHAP